MNTFPLARNLEGKWGWLVGLGVLKVFCGLVALAFVGLTSVLSVLYLGALFMVTGIAEIVFAIRTRGQGHLWYHLLFGTLYAVAGFIIFANPIANLLFLTVLISAVLIVSGTVNLIGSLVDRFPGWGWFAFNGAISAAAGFIIMSRPFESSLWVVGVLVGVEFLVRGFAWITLGLAGRSVVPHGDLRATRT